MRPTLITFLLALALTGAFFSPASAQSTRLVAHITVYDADGKAHSATLGCWPRRYASGFLAGRAARACPVLRRLIRDEAGSDPVRACAARVYGAERAVIDVRGKKFKLARTNACEQARWQRYRSLTRLTQARR